MFYNFRSDVRARRIYVDAVLIDGKPLELFVNLQEEGALQELESGLLSVLQGNEENYEAFDEHTKIYADKEKTTVKSYVKAGSDKPEEGEYPTMEVYELVCGFNITAKIMNQFWSGEEKIDDYDTELKKKMDLISPSEVKTV